MSSPITGQVSVSGTAQVLSVPIDVAAWSLKAPVTNSNSVFVGNSSVTSSTGHQLDPGETFDYERSSQNGQPKYQIGPQDVYVVGSNGDKVTWFASPGGA